MCWNGPEDFQSYSPGRVSACNCLMWNRRFTTASCAGMRRNDLECASVGHNLGTNRVELLPNDLIRPPQQLRRDRQAEGLGGLEIDDQIELRGLLDGESAGFKILST